VSDQLGVLDAVTLASFVLAWQNLIENREQSAHNDVSAANDRQAAYLLDKVGERLDRIEAKLDALERSTDGSGRGFREVEQPVG
jgi:hypothetical protein